MTESGVGKPVTAAQCRGRSSEPVCPWDRDTWQELSWKSDLSTGFLPLCSLREGRANLYFPTHTSPLIVSVSRSYVYPGLGYSHANLAWLGSQNFSLLTHEGTIFDFHKAVQGLSALPVNDSLFSLFFSFQCGF